MGPRTGLSQQLIGHVSPNTAFADEHQVMQRALEIAPRGIGRVEPNPAVGAVIVDHENRFIAEGFHQRFGDAHAEVNAIVAAGGRTHGATLFVTLEPCSHHGKTPPCADAVIAAGFQRVVIGCQDPAPHVAGQGIARLRDAGLKVEVGVCEADAQALIAPFRKLMNDKLPWVHAKWAMTLDGKIASHTGHSKWISGEQSRAEVHRLRGRMDAIITGAGTVRADDPLLTARPPGPRTALRVVVDSCGSSISAETRLLQTIGDAPLLISVTEDHAESDHMRSLAASGVEVHGAQGAGRSERVADLLLELGRRGCTNVLLESGAGLMGAFFDGDLVDEVHVFVAPKIVGGQTALSPVGGEGCPQIPAAASLTSVSIESFGADTLIRGRIRRDK